VRLYTAEPLPLDGGACRENYGDTKGFDWSNAMVRHCRVSVFLSRIGTRSTKIEEYRDNFLIILVTIGLFIALLPLFEALEGRTPSDSQVTSGLIWLAVALSISILSSNWNHILAIACGFIGLRGILGAIKTRGDLRAIATLFCLEPYS
jgi:hypothetical protein